MLDRSPRRSVPKWQQCWRESVNIAVPLVNAQSSGDNKTQTLPQLETGDRDAGGSLETAIRFGRTSGKSWIAL